MSRYLLLFILALSDCGLRAETFTVEGTVARALRANPDLAAARWSIEEARGRYLQSGRLPNPELEAEIKPNVKGHEFSFSASFNRKYPLTKRLFFERAVSEAGLRAAEAEVRNAERLLKSEVRTAAIKLLALDARKRLNERQRKNSMELVEAAVRDAKVGEGSQLLSGQFELEASRISLDLLEADAERAAITGALRPLLGLSNAETIGIAGELSAPATHGKGAAPAHRPDFQAAVAKEEAARSELDIARAGKWDDATYGLSAEFERMEDAPHGLENDGFIGFKFSLPLPLWNKNEGKIHEAAAAAAKAAQEKDALGLRIRAEAAAAHAEMSAAAKILSEISGPLLKKARDLEELHRSANKLGQSPLTDVLRSREQRFALETAHLNALRDYHLARVRLLAAQGH